MCRPRFDRGIAHAASGHLPLVKLGHTIPSQQNQFANKRVRDGDFEPSRVIDTKEQEKVTKLLLQHISTDFAYKSSALIAIAVVTPLLPI